MKLLREPLVHFLFAAGLLFALNAIIDRQRQAVRSHRIEVTEADVGRIALSWRAHHDRPPTVDELDRAVADWVRTEVLAREAVGLGLDRDDEAIRSTLARKMEVFADSAANLPEPTPAEVTQWKAAHPGAEIDDLVARAALRSERSAAARNAFYTALRSRYDVVLPPAEAMPALTGTTGAAVAPPPAP